MYIYFTLILVYNKYKQDYVVEFTDLEPDILAETVWVMVSLKDQRKLVIWTYYWPPDKMS